ncbi:hypothetical protein EK733_09640, partial [Campylobacter jejuni]|nr:hypothetical protein [Campylobacter jejuni]EAM0153623.1 hypothetical protein [Campylobacter jejuni]
IDFFLVIDFIFHIIKLILINIRIFKNLLFDFRKYFFIIHSQNEKSKKYFLILFFVKKSFFVF